MNLSFFIARRYFLSRRKKNFINIISILSMLGVAFITAALIIVLSVFNGLEDLLRSLNNAFDPEIKIVASEGKSFTITDSLLRKIESVPGVETATQVIEDYAYVRYRDATQVVMLKGVSEDFIDQHRIDDSIVEGELALKKDGINYAIIGMGVKITLSVSLEDDLHALQLYYIKNSSSQTLNPANLYVQKAILPGAVFSIIQNLDENYVIVPLEFAEELLNYGNKRTSLEIKTNGEADKNSIQKKLKMLLGENFSVLNHEQQHKDLYRLLKMEKLFTFLAFSMLLGIGSINIFFSLMMLALDKQKDISILSAMGASEKLIQRIFLAEGALISVIGSFTGLMLGGIFCWLQVHFGIISMGMETSVVEGYPIKMVFTDFLNTLLVVSVITFIISYRPAILASRSFNVQHL